MKVLHVITGLGDGGAEGVLSRLCLYSKDVNHVVVSLMDGGKYGSILRAAGIPVYCLGLNPSRPNPIKIFSLIKKIRKEAPDVVQTWMYHADLFGGIAARLAGVRSIFWGIRHSVLEKGKSKRSTIVIAKLCAWLSSFVPTKIICCAEKALQVHAEIGYRKSKLVVVQNGYDLGKFQPDNELRTATRQKFGIGDEICLLGMVGRYDPLKDHKNLLSALSFLPKKENIKCLLVGKGLDQKNSELVEIISKLALQDMMVLAGQQTNIPAIMNALDIHILSSSSEGFPNVLTEAMACGTPCITTDVGDAAIIVGDTGWLMPAQDSKLLADAVFDAITEKEERLPQWQMRKDKCRSRIEDKFSIETMINGYLAVWNS